MFIFGEHKLSFYISTVLWLRKYDVFDFPFDHTIEVSRDFLGGGFLVLSHELAKFRIHRPCESGDITFFICHVTTISKCHVTLWVESPHPKSPPC